MMNNIGLLDKKENRALWPAELKSHITCREEILYASKCYFMIVISYLKFML